MREKIRLMSTAGTGHYYTTTKNRRLHPEKMEVMKYDPRVRKHVDVQRDEDQVARGVNNAAPKEKPAERRVFRLRGFSARWRPPVSAAQGGLAHRAERPEIRDELLQTLNPALFRARAPLAEIREQTLVARVGAFPQILELTAELQNGLESRVPLRELRETLARRLVEHLRVADQRAACRAQQRARVVAEALDLAAQHRQRDVVGVVSQHVHAIHDDRAQLVDIGRDARRLLLELRHRRDATNLREPEEHEHSQVQPAHVDFVAAHRETRRRRERVMIVVQLLARDEHADRPEIRRAVVGLEVAIALRVRRGR